MVVEMIGLEMRKKKRKVEMIVGDGGDEVRPPEMGPFLAGDGGRLGACWVLSRGERRSEEGRMKEKERERKEREKEKGVMMWM